MTKTSKLPKAWSLYGWNERAGELDKLPKRVRVLLSAEWAASVLHIWVAERSPDYRPANAIHAAWNWVEGGADDNYAADAAADASAANSAAYAADAAAHADDAAYAAHAAAYAAYACAYAADTKWRWLYHTYLRCKGPKLSFDPAWRTTEAVALARGMWERRRADCLPILADALEEAGLSHEKTLYNLRDDHEHGLLSDWVIWNLLQFN